MDIWPTVHAERKALADDLQNLDTEQWATPSLCGDWTVRDVLAHLTSAGKLTPPAFFGKMIGSGFSFDKVQEKGIAANRGATPADTLANFESVVTSVKHPPGPTQTWLGETIVHSEGLAQSSVPRSRRSLARALRSACTVGQISMCPPLGRRCVASGPYCSVVAKLVKSRTSRKRIVSQVRRARSLVRNRQRARDRR